MVYIEYEWDPEKARRNLEKHGVSFELAITVFDDLDALDFPDFEHSKVENRRVRVGRSDAGVLKVIYTERMGRCRLISARRADRDERRLYETKN